MICEYVKTVLSTDPMVGIVICECIKTVLSTDPMAGIVCDM